MKLLKNKTDRHQNIIAVSVNPYRTIYVPDNTEYDTAIFELVEDTSIKAVGESSSVKSTQSKQKRGK